MLSSLSVFTLSLYALDPYIMVPVISLSNTHPGHSEENHTNVVGLGLWEAPCTSLLIAA
jgi:hypothetical protein